MILGFWSVEVVGKGEGEEGILLVILEEDKDDVSTQGWGNNRYVVTCSSSSLAGRRAENE